MRFDSELIAEKRISSKGFIQRHFNGANVDAHAQGLNITFITQPPIVMCHESSSRSHCSADGWLREVLNSCHTTFTAAIVTHFLFGLCPCGAPSVISLFVYVCCHPSISNPKQHCLASAFGFTTCSFVLHVYFSLVCLNKYIYIYIYSHPSPECCIHPEIHSSGRVSYDHFFALFRHTFITVRFPWGDSNTTRAWQIGAKPRKAVPCGRAMVQVVDEHGNELPPDDETWGKWGHAESRQANVHGFESCFYM